MAKKKTQSKKHKFKHAEAGSITSDAHSGSVVKSTQSTSARSAAVAAGSQRDFSYVPVDVRRIAVLAIVLVSCELLLWLLFSHTPVGNTVYNAVKL